MAILRAYAEFKSYSFTESPLEQFVYANLGDFNKSSLALTGMGGGTSTMEKINPVALAGATVNHFTLRSLPSLPPTSRAIDRVMDRASASGSSVTTAGVIMTTNYKIRSADILNQQFNKSEAYLNLLKVVPKETAEKIASNLLNQWSLLPVLEAGMPREERVRIREEVGALFQRFHCLSVPARKSADIRALIEEETIFLYYHQLSVNQDPIRSKLLEVQVGQYVEQTCRYLELVYQNKEDSFPLVARRPFHRAISEIAEKHK